MRLRPDLAVERQRPWKMLHVARRLGAPHSATTSADIYATARVAELVLCGPCEGMFGDNDEVDEGRGDDRAVARTNMTTQFQTTTE